MNKLLFICSCLLIIVFASGCAKQNATEKTIPDTNSRTVMNYDANGNTVKTVYKKVPEKVLILYPGATEAMLELGLDNHIMYTISPYGSEPEDIAERFNNLPKLKAAFIPALEEVFAMQPDLIIGWAHNFSPVELGSVHDWKSHNIPVYIVPATIPHDLPTLENSVYPFISDLGKIFDCQEKAQEQIDSYKQREQFVLSQVAGKEGKTAMVLQDHGKSSYSLYGPDYLINDLLNKAGLTNLVRQKTSFVGPERVLNHDPDYLIFVSLPDSNGNDLSDEEVKKLVSQNRDLAPLRAVKEGRIINIPFAEVNSGNGRAIDALEKLLKARKLNENF